MVHTNQFMSPISNTPNTLSQSVPEIAPQRVSSVWIKTYPCKESASDISAAVIAPLTSCLFAYTSKIAFFNCWQKVEKCINDSIYITYISADSISATPDQRPFERCIPLRKEQGNHRRNTHRHNQDRRKHADTTKTTATTTRECVHIEISLSRKEQVGSNRRNTGRRTTRRNNGDTEEEHVKAQTTSITTRQYVHIKFF